MTSDTEDDAAPSKRGQLALDLGEPKLQYTRAAFVVSASNAGAAAMVDGFVASVEPAMAICGPPASGKSHLAHILADENLATVRDANDLDSIVRDGALAVIDASETCSDSKRLFALLEERRSRGVKTALAGRGRPAEWAKGLKDLATRLEAMPRATLAEPDEALMRRVIEQQFRSRQWRAAEGVAAYAAPRLPRTFAAANAFVEEAGRAAVAQRRAINLALAREIVGRLSEGFACE